jgi:hypothetical protein
MEFNALVDFDSKTAKQKMLALLDVAGVILEHDAKINNLYLDDAELQNADVEDAFESIRTLLRDATVAVNATVDA